MIKKLSHKIFWVIMISLSVVTLGIIILFSILNYKNTINSAVSMMDRFASGEIRKSISDKINMEEPPESKDINIEGLLYYITIEDGRVINNINSTYGQEIEECAIEASTKNRENGIIGKYIYTARKNKGGTIRVVLMENESAIAHTKMILVISVVVSVLSLILIYIIAKKVSKIIVKPVEETFEKQKQFISDASHELKTPLAVIEANADVLENEVGSNKWLTYIQNEIESMNKLINELLLLAKMENSNSKNYEEFNLSEEIEMVTSMFESMAYENKINFNIDIQKDIKMKGNKEDIEHILSTLLDNAIKHTEPEKQITVQLKKEKDKIFLQVKNMGEPIPKEEKEKIFERFYRIDKARNRNEKRYGLGLAIAKSTVQKYNGKIEVYCKDGITTFEVTIPQQ